MKRRVSLPFWEWNQLFIASKSILERVAIIYLMMSKA